MNNIEYTKLISILDNYRSTTLDIAAKATDKINDDIFNDILELYQDMEITKESLIKLREIL